MTDTSQLGHERSGIAFIVLVGLAAMVISTLLSPIVPWARGAWVFVALVAIAFAWPAISARADAPDGSDGDVMLDVGLLDWANALVGTTCLRCEEEINYIPLGMTEGRSEHRIECGCTLIESTAKG